MLKVSKYTFVCRNKSGELLFYNTLEGVNSFCKLSQDNFDEGFVESLDVKYINEAYYGSLREKGILIEEGTDERRKLYHQMIKTLNPNKLVLFINPTEQCNFRCKYCYESHSRGEMSEDTQNNIIKFVRENIHNFAGLHVEWFGGEPLLALDCIRRLSLEFQRICRFNKRKYDASMTTNGYLLTKEVFEELLEYNVKQYQITIDGVEEDHDMFRVLCGGAGTFSTILDNIQEIKKLKRRDFSIILRSNVSVKNFESIDDFLKLLEKLSWQDNRIRIGIFKVGNWLDKAQTDIVDEIIEDTSDMRRIYKAILESEYNIRLSDLFLNPGSGVCYAGKLNNFLICADGSLHKCTVTFEDKDSVVGKIQNGRLECNEKFYEMISDFNKCDKVFECFNAPVCMGEPCPVKGEGGSSCSYFKDTLDIVLQIFDKMGKFDLLEV